MMVSMQEWLRYIAEHNIPVYNVYIQCYYIGNVGRKMIIMDRTRRLRMNATLRDMVRENHVRVDELIYPVFVTEENDVYRKYHQCREYVSIRLTMFLKKSDVL